MNPHARKKRWVAAWPVSGTAGTARQRQRQRPWLEEPPAPENKTKEDSLVGAEKNNSVVGGAAHARKEDEGGCAGRCQDEGQCVAGSDLDDRGDRKWQA